MRSQLGLRPQPDGLDAAGILNAAAAGSIDVLVLLGADPISDFPDALLARKAIEGARVVVALDAFLTESSSLADVVLPAAVFGEKAGTTTNLEGRVTTVTQRVTPAGTARADWMVAAELADALGQDELADDAPERRARSPTPSRHGAGVRRRDPDGARRQPRRRRSP